MGRKTNEEGKRNLGCALVLGLGWTLFSLVFVGLGVMALIQGVEKSRWIEVPCEVLEFRVEAVQSSDPPFLPHARYRYQWEGQTYEGTKVWKEKEGEDNYSALALLEEQHRQGGLSSCRVNPKNPTEAVLLSERGQVIIGLVFIIVGSLFSLVGIGALVKSLKAKRGNNQALSSQASNLNQPTDLKEGRSLGWRIFLFALGCGFVAGGLWSFWKIGGEKWLAAKNAEQWAASPATVIWSQVKSHSSDDGTTYSVDIFYRYQHEETLYRSNQFNFSIGGSSSGRNEKEEIVARYPSGSDFTCYCNPERPWEAVIERKVGKVAIIIAIVCLVILAGIGLLILRMLFSGKPSQSDVSDIGDFRDFESGSLASSTERSQPAQTGELVLEVGGKRVKGLLGAVFVALIVNGIAYLCFRNLWEGWGGGVNTVVVVVFSLAGVGTILNVLYCLLALYNPKPKLRIAAADLVLGRELAVQWEISGASARIQKWSLFLVGSERVTYRRGTDRRTDEQVFYEEEIIVTESASEIASGRASIQIPVNLVPSWKANSNEIIWKIVQRGEIAKWPDIQGEDVVQMRTETL